MTALREHVEAMTATIGGTIYAASHGFAGDILKVALAAAVSALVGHLSKWLIQKGVSLFKNRKTKNQN